MKSRQAHWARMETWRRALCAFALLALAARALVAPGYMLAAEPEGRTLALALCGQHAGTAALDLETGEFIDADADRSAPEDRAASDLPCAFAALAAAAPPATQSALEAPRLAQTAPAPLLETLRPGQGLAAPPPWPTGPPRHA